MKNLSTNLRTLIANAKLSENELARRTGISQQIINRILSGENANPKIATLSPIARYFTLSISQLIGEELTNGIPINPSTLGWQEIPLFSWDKLYQLSFEKISVTNQPKMLVDLQASTSTFAVKLEENSMEPKFAAGTLLVFDFEKKPLNRDFVLVQLDEYNILFRQLLLKNNTLYIKCLNPNHENHRISSLNKDSRHLGTLVQSRTVHSR